MAAVAADSPDCVGVVFVVQERCWKTVAPGESGACRGESMELLCTQSCAMLTS